MTHQFDRKIRCIRDGWSQVEREIHKRSAEAMQWQLRQIVAISAFRRPSQKNDKKEISYAGAR